MAKVKSCSLLTFIYPITINHEDFDKVADEVDAAMTPDGGLKIWDPDKFPHDELLPHVADYLNPRGGQPPTARLWFMTDGALNSPKGLGGKSDWNLVLGKDREIPFKFKGINLFLFRVGVGFLTFEIDPLSTDLDDWLDLIHYFRYTNRKHYLSARLGTGKDTWEYFFPPIAAPDAKQKSDGAIEEARGKLSQIVDGLFNIIGEGGRLPVNWWSEIFIPDQMLPYASLFVEDLPDGRDYRLLYDLRNFFPGEKDSYPSNRDLLPDHPSLLEYSHRQWFSFALDGGSFLACDPPDNAFFNVTLPDHINLQYFHVFIIALHQRFALMSMSHEVAEKWLATAADAKNEAFDRIRDRFLSFTARGYFAQVMQRDHHHRYYRKWQETFELQKMYDEVREEVREMFEWLQLKRSEKIAKKVSFFGWIFTLGIGLPALLTSFFGMNFTESMPFDISLKTGLIALAGSIVAGISLATLMYKITTRKHR